jgi:hypothetical protein
MTVPMFYTWIGQPAWSGTHTAILVMAALAFVILSVLVVTGVLRDKR